MEGRREPITPLEYGVMLALVRASGRVVTRDEMLGEVVPTGSEIVCFSFKTGSDRWTVKMTRLVESRCGAAACPPNGGFVLTQ